jgi:signal peptidase I
MIKKRNQFLAGLATFGALGLGQLYNGKPTKAAFMYGFPFVCLAINLFFPISSGFSHLLVFEGLLIFIVLLSIFDAVRDARKQREFALHAYNRWYIYVAIILVNALLISSLQLSLLTSSTRAYRIPVGSMMPTLEIGDRLVADMKAFKKKLPIRGDIIIFKYPNDELSTYVKRVIGLPGEKIEMIGRTVYINGRALKESYVQYISPESINAHYGPYVLPQGQYFVLGDDRDNSQDSRFFGAIAQSKITGQARYLYWAKNASRIGKKLE